MGEFESVDTEPAVTHIVFKDRKTAERAFFSLHGKELGGVEGTLDLAWVNTPLPPATTMKSESATPAVAAATGPGAGGSNTAVKDDMEEGEIEGSEEGEMRQDDGQEEREMDMDYDAW
jgi:hypothetical protein